MLTPAAALSAYYFAYFAYVGAYSPYITLYLKDIGMTAAQIGLLYSIPQVMRIFGPNAWGHLADSTGRPRAIVRVAACASLLGFAGMYLGTSFAWIFAVLVAMHFFTSAQMPLIEAVTLDQVRESPGHYGRIRVWGSVGFVIAVLGLGYLLDYLPVRTVLHVTTALLALVLLAALAMPAPRRVVTDAPRESLRGKLKLPAVRVFLAAGFLNAFAHAALYTFFSIYLDQNGYSKSAIGWMWTIGVLIEIIVFQCLPQLTKRFSLETLFFSTFVFCAIRFTLIAWAVEWWQVLVIAQLMHAFTFAIYHASAVALAGHLFGAGNQARGQAVYISLTFGLGGFAGAMISGGLWEIIGPSWTYMLSAAAGALGALLLWPGQRGAALHR